jgi:hypothetical protein
MTTKERFLAKVIVGPSDACWIWNGYKTKKGYGQFWDGKKKVPAHWGLLDAYPPKGMDACHRCDNPSCVRPSHIFIGTRTDNMRDCSSKGRLKYENGLLAASGKRRYNSGEDNHASVLTEADAKIIRSTPRAYGIGVKLAKRFGVSPAVISGIQMGKRWKRTSNPRDSK